MSPEEMVGPADSCGTDVAAYALGALDGHEAAAFEQHLRSCAVCPVELAAFQQVVDVVADSTPPMRAPRSLRRRVLSTVAAEARGTAEPRAARRRAPRLSLGFGGVAFGAGLAFAVAAVVVVVIAFPGKMANRTIQATVTGSGSAALRIANGHAEIVVHHFASPPKGKVYEVWLQRGKRLSPTSELFSVDHDGNTTVDVPGSLYGVSRVLVTPEPAGGSRQPTHKPVIDATI